MYYVIHILVLLFSCLKNIGNAGGCSVEQPYSLDNQVFGYPKHFSCMKKSAATPVKIAALIITNILLIG